MTTESEENQEKIIPQVIEDEMKSAYLDYSMSVIVGRALPDARDGLKPVHRRIIYAMNDMGIRWNTAYKKCARIVGEVLGKYHPHGDQAVYDSLVRMAQTFSLRNPLVQGQGNFGCFTKDTKVALADGRKLSFNELIKEFKQGKKNYTYTINDKEIKVAEIKHPRLTKINQPIMKVVLDNGQEIKCTLDHRFMLRNGEYKEAKDLKSNESLMPLYTRLSQKEDKLKPEINNYLLVLNPNNKEWVLAHHLADKYNLENGIYAKSNGRVRHHIDFNKLNNNPNNIQRMNWKDHWKLHSSLTKEKHKTNAEYVKKLAEGRKSFWSKQENKDKYSERLRKRNTENWKNPVYREKMIAFLSKVNKEHIKKHPELRKEYSERATSTLKKLWKNPDYKKLMNKKIIKANKSRISNNTGKVKFIKIFKETLEKEQSINEYLYEKHRNIIYSYGHAPTWFTGMNKYYANEEIETVLNDACENHKVAYTEILNRNEDVYDLTIDGTHNFALAAGVFVHNSVDGDRAAAMRYCVTGDTLIMTEKGLVPVGNLSTTKTEAKINLKIKSYDGKTNKATKFFNSGKQHIIKITTNNGFILKGTKNHPVLCWELNEFGMPSIQWKLLGEITEKDHVIINRKHQLFTTKNSNLKKYHPSITRSKEITLPKEMTKELAFLLGALVAEGSFHQKKIIFNNKNVRFYEECKNILIKTFKGTTLHERDIKKDCKEFELYHQQAVKFLINIGLKEAKSDKKEIPFTILESKKEVITSFLKGLFEGDGSVSLKKDKRQGGKSIELTYNSKSDKLIFQLKTLLLNFGIITQKPYKDKRNECYKLIISGADNIHKFHKEIDFFSQRKKEELAQIKKINNSKMSKTDTIPFLNEYLRKNYTKTIFKKNNFDRYNKLIENYSKVKSQLKESDKNMLDWIIKNDFFIDKISKKETLQKEFVYSIKVDSKCHSFIGNGFINHNTEARLSKISQEMIQDIDKETVPFMENFDGSLTEPTVLPSKFPNLLVNGSTGIAVGMATNIPPHNLKEISRAVIRLIDDPDVQDIDLLQDVKGPDFPTGGIIIGKMGMMNAYATGRGKVLVRSKIEEEVHKGKQRIIVTEIPYMVNKAELIIHIADCVKDKKIEGISDLRDESDRKGMRIVIELKKDANVDLVKNQLLAHTRLQDTFGITLLALVDNTPKVMTLKTLLKVYLGHRQVVVRKRTEFDLRKAEERAHILEGLIIALDDIDNAIVIIKKSESANEAKTNLISKYSLTEVQAQAILDMKLQKLAQLEADKIRIEHKELQIKISDLKEILADEQKILNIIKLELQEIIETYGTDRLTEVSEVEDEEMDIEDLIPVEDVIVSQSNAGYVKRMPLDTYRIQGRGGKGVIGAENKEEDFIENIFIANTHQHLLVFTDKGKVHWLKVYKIPESSRYSKGKAIINLIEIDNGDKISAVIPVKQFDDAHYLLTATKRGIVKKTALSAYSRPRRGGIIAQNLDEGDKLVGVSLTDGNQKVLLATKKGSACKFDEKDARPIGRTSRGVTGIRLRGDDEVVGMILVDEDTRVLTLTSKGYGKQTMASEYRLINRGGKGVININLTNKNGEVVAIRALNGGEELMLATRKGMVIRQLADGINVIGRNTQGVRVIRLKEGDELVSCAKMMSEEEAEKEVELEEKELQEAPKKETRIEKETDELIKKHVKDETEDDDEDTTSDFDRLKEISRLSRTK